MELGGELGGVRKSSSLPGVLGEIYKAGVGSEFFLNVYLCVLWKKKAGISGCKV